MDIGGSRLDEILIRLPVKSLLRFKLVRKDWCFHIQSDDFIAKHMKYQKTNEKSLIYHNPHGAHNYVLSICSEQEKKDDADDADDADDDDSRALFQEDQQCRIDDMPLDDFMNYGDYHVMNILDNYYKHVQLIGTCNGLVCLAYPVWTGANAYDMIITLWNPATRDFKTLPPCEPQPPPTPRLLLRNDHIGFSFDCSSNDYKVIRVMDHYDKRSFIQVAIYSLNTNSWRELDYYTASAIMAGVNQYKGTTIYLGEKVYWAILAFDILNDKLLLSFDMDKEVFQYTSLPSEYMALVKQFRDNYIITNFFTLHNSVALVFTTKTRVDIWSTKELEQGCALWIKVLNIDHVPGLPEPLGFWNCKNSNDDLFMFTIFGKDETKGTFVKDRGDEKLMTIKVENNIVSPMKLVTYVETLVSVK